MMFQSKRRRYFLGLAVLCVAAATMFIAARNQTDQRQGAAMRGCQERDLPYSEGANIKRDDGWYTCKAGHWVPIK